MDKRVILVAGGVIIILLVLGVYLTGPTIPPAQPEWHKIKTFTGIEDKTTDLFTIPSSASKWKATWTTTYKEEYSQYAAFYCFVYPSGETAAYTTSFDGLSGESFVYETGSFYLKVLAANLESWRIEVWAYY